MKIGLDTNDDFVSKTIKNKINKKNFLVDMSLEKNKNIGNEVFEKVLIANNSRLDFYLRIEIRKGNENIKIYSGNKEKSKKFSTMFLEELNKLSLNNLSLTDGENYFLIKNIKSPVIIIKIYVDENSKLDKDELVNKIIKCIDNF